MVNNQEQFNENYNEKEVKEIKLKRKEFTGQLVIEDYSELENLSLRDVKSIDWLILKNLTQLHECTIWDCNLKKLMIENCPQMKKLNIRSNLLTNLGFLKGLDSLEELEVDGNAEIFPETKYLPSHLRIFTCSGTKLQPFQELVELAKQNPQELAKDFWDLQKKYNILKKSLTSLAEINSQELIGLKTEELEKEFNQQFEEFKNKLKFGKEYTELFIQEKEVHIKIQQLENELEKLVNLAKSKLESKKWWDLSEEKQKRTKDRKLLFEQFLSDQNLATGSDKELLEKKLGKEGLDIIRQKQKQLTGLKTELESLQNQQTQIQVLPKN